MNEQTVLLDRIQTLSLEKAEVVAELMETKRMLSERDDELMNMAINIARVKRQVNDLNKKLEAVVKNG